MAEDSEVTRATPSRTTQSLALYRKYRPATFAEVRGQDHVTEPLRQALRSGRINHAYLFSGPRGCGKTSSARILARSLNCVQGPTPDPCGVCDSCVALAPSGAGSIDVIEIDAASHGGVDDARDLRERAFYAPVAGRYKIYIIDEAHMVTQQGFNALLKLVEEPPPHLKFIFATTEPEKVIATIRSRTHHYPFRLMPPSVMRDLTEEILNSEGVTFDPAVLPLVVRAGGGSARDTLSILDQLLAGLGRGRDQVRPRGRAARLHRCEPARRDRGRVRERRRGGGVPRGEPGHRGRPRAAPVRHRHAGPVPRPDRARLGARRHRHRPARHPAGPGRGADRPGRAVRAGRADPGGRHRLDRSRPDARGHLAPAAARAHVRAGAAARRRDRRAVGPRPAGTAGGGRGRSPGPAAGGRRRRKCSYRTVRGACGPPAVSGPWRTAGVGAAAGGRSAAKRASGGQAVRGAADRAACGSGGREPAASPG